MNAFDRSLALYPTSSEILVERGSALYKLSRYREAAASYQHALSFGGERPETLYSRGIALVDAGYCEDAVADLDRAWELGVSTLELQGARVQALYCLGRREETMQVYELYHPPGARAKTHYELAVRALNGWKNALAFTTQLIEERGPSAQFYSEKGLYLRYLKRHEEALLELDMALALDPKHYASLLYKSIVLAQLGSYEESIASLELAAELAPFYRTNRTSLNNDREYPEFIELKADPVYGPRFLALTTAD